MAAKGGGAGKVAYADFVTAMMAFFLVMWICGQDQQLRKAVAYSFNDPFNTSKIGTSKQPGRTGSVVELNPFGSMPHAESVALGQGRKSHTPEGGKGTATKLIWDWLHADENLRHHWEEQARKALKQARNSREVLARQTTVERAALRGLAQRLQQEISLDITARTRGLQQDLLYEVLGQVNWMELAEDRLPR